MTMSVFSALHYLAPTLLPLAAGYALARFVGMPLGPLRLLSRFALLPLALFAILSGPLPSAALPLTVTAVAMTLAGLACVRALRRWPKFEALEIAALPNIACFALPFVALSWEGKGLRPIALIFVIVAIASLFIAGGKSSWRQLYKEPWLYGAAAGLLYQLLAIPHSKFIDMAIGPLADAAYPILLLYLGTTLYPLGGLRQRSAWTTVGVRFVVGLAVALLAITILPMPRLAREAVIIVSLAPPMTQASSLIGTREHDPGEGRAAANIGTLLSLLAMLALLMLDW